MADAVKSSGDSVDSALGDTVDGWIDTCVQFWKKLLNIKDNSENRYSTDFPSVGLCLIFNNEHFKPWTGMKPRTGAQLDVAAATKTFGNLGYEVVVHQDLTCSEMLRQLEKVSQQDHSDHASFACVILSHGKEGEVYGTDGAVQFDELSKYFKGERCKSLLGKPKLFFIDTCRGEKTDEGTDVVDGAMQETSSHRIPVEADFLYAYATAPGFASQINSFTGSWFIQTACKLLEEHKDLELVQIMTRVNRKVAYEYETFKMHFWKLTVVKQMPCIVSMLTKEFYFP